MMGDYQILTDCVSDLPADIVENNGISVLPMAFAVGDDSYMQYYDYRELGIKEFYNRLRAEETVTTSQVNYHTFIDYFEPVLKDGRDILFMALSSALSGTYNASLLAVEELMNKYPERKIYCIDTLSASCGEGMLVYYALEKKKEGMDIDQLRDWVLDNCLNLCHWFTVDDLGHLKRGGRVSALASVVGTMLGVKPVLHVDNEGQLIPMFKVRGRRRALEALVQQMEKSCTKPEEQTIFIGHGDCLEEAEQLAQMIREKIKVKDIVISFVGSVIGAHSGPGTLALFFFGKER